MLIYIKNSSSAPSSFKFGYSIITLSNGTPTKTTTATTEALSPGSRTLVTSYKTNSTTTKQVTVTSQTPV